jgi:cytochrome c oxidase assembly protein subunit 11
MSDDNSHTNPNRKLVSRLFLGVAGMFAFGFLLVPLYDVICEVTGLNGKTGDQVVLVDESALVVDEAREITVQFIAHHNSSMGWTFTPSTRQMTVRPGEMHVMYYKVSNPNGHKMIGQAIPSVAPNAAAAHLKKIECFCFDEQPLEPGESAEMPLRFYVDPDLPDRVTRLTLAYTLYDITESPREAARRNRLANN